MSSKVYVKTKFEINSCFVFGLLCIADTQFITVIV